MPTLNAKILLKNLELISLSQRNHEYFVGIEPNKNEQFNISHVEDNDRDKIQYQNLLANQIKGYINSVRPKISLEDRDNCSFELQQCFRKLQKSQYSMDVNFFPERITVKDTLILKNVILARENEILIKCNAINEELIKLFPLSILSRLSLRNLNLLSKITIKKRIVDRIIIDHSMPNEIKNITLLNEGINDKLSKMLYSCDLFDVTDFNSFCESLESLGIYIEPPENN